MWKARFLSLLLVLVLCPLSVYGKGFSTIYVLGDSLSDQGNLFQATYALTRLGIPVENYYYLGRFAEGEIYVDQLAAKLELPVEASHFGGSNFAYGGSRTDYNIVGQDLSCEAYPWSLNLQREAFAARGIVDPEALYVVFSGSDDVTDLIGAVLTQGPTVVAPVIAEVVVGISRVIEAFIAAGARDILVPLVPDLGLVPRVIAQDPLPGFPFDSKLVAQTATALTAQLNTAIVAMLKNYPQANIVVFDTFTMLQKVIAAPVNYGFENVSEACYSGFVDTPGLEQTICDDPSGYLFWDNEHPTTAGHQMLAEQMLQTLIEVMMAEFADELTQLDLLSPPLMQELAVIQKLLADENQTNDVAAIANLKAMSKFLEKLGSSSLVASDTGPLSARALQIAELVEANIR